MSEPLYETDAFRRKVVSLMSICELEPLRFEVFDSIALEPVVRFFHGGTWAGSLMLSEFNSLAPREILFKLGFPSKSEE